MIIKIATTEEEILSCFATLAELRSHLAESTFVETIHRMEKSNNFKLAYLDDNGIKAVAGFRISE